MTRPPRRLGGDTRGQALQTGGMVWAFAFFLAMIILGAGLKIMVIDNAVNPLIVFAEGMDTQSTQSQTGLSWLKQWVGAFTLIVLFLASSFLIARAALYSGRY